ncbi:MAG: acyl carrier protein [Acidobacteriota bacterium]|nr:acyl carrier protein [Blastocatellia bacterium]MDW8238451.1 acyl carrier protein [Acidobacteriota bacterium]
MKSTRQIIRQFICDNFIVSDDDFTDTDSMLDKQIIDSTGILELVAFLEEEFGIHIADEEMVPENLDTVSRICAFLACKCPDRVDQLDVVTIG